MAQSRRPWADLPPELLSCVADRSASLRSYAACSHVCSAWRSTVEPLSPALLLASTDGQSPPAVSAFSLLSRRALRLDKFPDHRCIGSSGCWLAFTFQDPPETKNQPRPTKILLVNPISGGEITLAELDGLGDRSVSKIVFTAPNTRKQDFAAVVLCGSHLLASVTARDAPWFIQTITKGKNDYLVDILLDNGGVDGKVYCLTRCGDVHVMHIPRCKGQELPVIKPLLHPFDPRYGFPPPYARVADIAGSKHLALCEGNLYQVWRNAACTVFVPPQQQQQQGGRRLRVPMNHIVVLRYNPRRWPLPCWDVVDDLGGSSVFVGRNNAFSVRADGVAGPRANCVYWVDELQSKPAPMVFEMETGRSMPCSAPSAHLRRAICWWDVLGHKKNSGNSNHAQSDETTTPC